MKKAQLFNLYLYVLAPSLFVLFNKCLSLFGVPIKGIAILTVSPFPFFIKKELPDYLHILILIALVLLTGLIALYKGKFRDTDLLGGFTGVLASILLFLSAGMVGSIIIGGIAGSGSGAGFIFSLIFLLTPYIATPAFLVLAAKFTFAYFPQNKITPTLIILIAVLVPVLAWIPYQLERRQNRIDAAKACSSLEVGMNINEVIQKTPNSKNKFSPTRGFVSLGFGYCSCNITLENEKITKAGKYFCMPW